MTMKTSILCLKLNGTKCNKNGNMTRLLHFLVDGWMDGSDNEKWFNAKKI